MKNDFSWEVLTPLYEPLLPKIFSFSFIKSFDSCPYKWYLLNSDYGFAEKGYPVNINIYAFVGSVVHNCLNDILKYFKNKNCFDFDNHKIKQLLISKGGLTSIVKENVEKLIFTYKNNPRFCYILEEFKPNISKYNDDIIHKLNVLFAKIKSNSKHEKIERNDKDKLFQLKSNIYTELVINNPEYKLKGVLDYVIVNDKGCIIIDFKTGEKNDNHLEQLKFYNMLWQYDIVYNKRKIPVKELKLLYSKDSLVIRGLNNEEIIELKNSYLNKINSINNNITDNNFPTILEEKKCAYCDVRHLCDEYWKNKKKTKYLEFTKSKYQDIEYRIIDQKTDDQFIIDILSVSKENVNKEIILIDKYEKHKGKTFRGLNLGVTSIDDESKIIINCFKNSEIFKIS